MSPMHQIVPRWADPNHLSDAFANCVAIQSGWGNFFGSPVGRRNLPRKGRSCSAMTCWCQATTQA
jgi:hypothetical protein